MLLVVTIERVSTMQPFVRVAFVWPTSCSHDFPQTTSTDDAVNITSELHDPRTLVMISVQKREKT